MKITMDTRELDALRRNIAGFSERRMKAVVATALTRTARRVRDEWTRQLTSDIDRPTARTMTAATFASARADRLEASVALKNQLSGVAPADYLKPQLFGGSRVLKKFEQALISSGAMPRGYLAVPGRGAQRDGYGNVSRAQLVAVIRALGQDYSPGYQRVISKSTARRLQSQAKHGRRYIAFLPADAKRVGVSPGIYERMPGRRLVAIFLYKNQVSYKRLLRLVDREAIAAIEQDLKQETDRALAESLQRLRVRGGQ